MGSNFKTVFVDLCVPQTSCTFALTCLSVKSSIWSMTVWIWASIADRSWAIAANQRHDTRCTPDSGLPAQPGSESECLIRLTQPRPTAAACLSHLVPPSALRALSDVGLKVVWAIDDGADWWLLILTLPCIKRPSPKRDWKSVWYRGFTLKSSHSYTCCFWIDVPTVLQF